MRAAVLLPVCHGHFIALLVLESPFPGLSRNREVLGRR
jgi:hypothetical protein